MRDAYTTLLHDKKMKRVILDIIYAVAYFALFVGAVFTKIPAADTLFQLGRSVSSMLASSGADTITNDSTMKVFNIQTISDTFDWLTDTLVPSVFVTENYNGNALESDRWGNVANFNKVLSAVIFETKSVQEHPCEAKHYFLDLYPICYDPYNVKNETVLISFDTNATEATNVINKLKANSIWLNFSTQTLEITVVTYNGEMRVYAVTKLGLDFGRGGWIQLYAATTPALANPFKNFNVILLDVLVGVCWLVGAKRFANEFVL